ncbi:monocarboxylate transporter 1 [Brevipalpus obovatus]|uniref:monocarboxylate transporter 1 n=1 Tax=Brevipalpus obovatus TaxID=246614 RepID=UPI003D9F0B0D
MKANGEAKKSPEDIDESPVVTTTFPEAPDGGYGWVIVFSSFMIHFLADGVTYTFGIFYVELLKNFSAGKGITAWVPSMMTGMTYGIGPIASGLINKYGCRSITILGSLCAGTGLALSAFAPNVLVLFFTIGICTGAGFGLMYLPAIVSVTCYFKERRAFATGLAVCGSGLGSAAMAPLTEYLIGLYGWRGGMLLVSGLVLNCCVFGALLRPLETKSSDSTMHKNDMIFHEKTSSKMNVSELDPLDTGHHQSNHHLNFAQSLILSKQNSPSRHSVGGYHPDDNGKSLCGSNGQFSTLQNQEKTCKLLESESRNDCRLIGQDSKDEEGGLLNRRKHSCSSSSGILYRKDIFYSASLINLQNNNQPNAMAGSISSSHLNYVRDESLIKSPEKKSSLLSCTKFCSDEIRDTLSEMMDFRLLQNPAFLLFSISNLLSSLGYYVPHIYIKDRAVGLNIPNDSASNLLAIIGISSMLGRLVFGFISDLKSIDRLLLFNCCLTFSGLSTLLSALLKTHTFLALYSAFFGITCGAYVSLTSVILVDLLGLEKLTNAFGLVLLFQGTGCLMGPPVVGWLFDYTKSYDPGFFWAGSVMLIGGLLLFFVPYIQKRSINEPKTPLVVIQSKDVVDL